MALLIERNMGTVETINAGGRSEALVVIKGIDNDPAAVVSAVKSFIAEFKLTAS